MNTLTIIAICLAFAPKKINPIFWLGRLYGKFYPPTEQEREHYKKYGALSFFMK